MSRSFRVKFEGDYSNYDNYNAMGTFLSGLDQAIYGMSENVVVTKTGKYFPPGSDGDYDEMMVYMYFEGDVVIKAFNKEEAGKRVKDVQDIIDEDEFGSYDIDIVSVEEL